MDHKRLKRVNISNKLQYPCRMSPNHISIHSFVLQIWFSPLGHPWSRIFGKQACSKLYTATVPFFLASRLYISSNRFETNETRTICWTGLPKYTTCNSLHLPENKCNRFNLLNFTKLYQVAESSYLLRATVIRTAHIIIGVPSERFVFKHFFEGVRWPHNIGNDCFEPSNPLRWNSIWNCTNDR